ncbi:Glycoprotein 3-alpha-L-fucosyltransferase A [Schistosoma japonicum]|nr:Glycoprotein 3-alpha-L-fucosyltransferase A [Schistosoma japonicum]
METPKDFTGFNPTIRFRIIIFLAVSTVCFGIFYIWDINLNEIGQYISNYRSFGILSMTRHSNLYSNFTDFRNDFIAGQILLNKSKKYEIIIFGHMLVTLNTDLTNCPVNNCIIHSDARRWISGDLILITDRIFPPGKRPISQAWVAHEYESAFHTRFSDEINDKINFTAIYRFDSTIRTPYGMYTPYERRTNDSDRTLELRKLENVANGKDRAVAWIVSNCNSKSPRKAYTDELAKHITEQCITHRYGCFD